MKICQTHLASISHVYEYLLLKTKLNPLWMQIKHLLSNDQSNACIAGTTPSVNVSPLGTFENQDARY